MQDQDSYHHSRRMGEATGVSDGTMGGIVGKGEHDFTQRIRGGWSRSGGWVQAPSYEPLFPFVDRFFDAIPKWMYVAMLALCGVGGYANAEVFYASEPEAFVYGLIAGILGLAILPLLVKLGIVLGLLYLFYQFVMLW